MNNQMDRATTHYMCRPLVEENIELKKRIAELEKEVADHKANIDHLMNNCHRFTDKRLQEHNLEQRAKALDELLTYPNHRFHGDSRVYYSEYSINRAIENLRNQARGSDV